MTDATLPSAEELVMQLAIMADRAAKLEAVLRLIRINVMGDFMAAESGMLRDWVKDWVDGFDNGVVCHSMETGTMLWPSQAAPGLGKQLRVMGFHPVEGPNGIMYVAIRPPAPAAGEAVN